jgi:GTP cyclohydrolase I
MVDFWVDRLAPHVRSLLRDRLGENESGRSGLRETPERVARAFIYATAGYSMDPETILKTFDDGAANYNEFVFVGRVPFWSTCEHHLAPFFGHAYLGYLPDGDNPRIVGLSKLARLVDVYARRLQVQERMTTEISDAITRHLKARAVGVVLKARHSCMEARGINRAGIITITSHMQGQTRENPAVRSEFFKLVDLADRNHG